MSDSEIKWEYHVLSTQKLKENVFRKKSMEPLSRLTGLGEAGWELVSFHKDDAYFKRRMASKDDAQSLFEE